MLPIYANGHISATDDPIHFNSCLVLGVFGDRGSNGAISGSNKSKMAAAAMLEFISIGHISATGRLIHFMFGSRVGFSGTADLVALFSIRTNPRWRPPPSWIISNDHISATAHTVRSTYIARIARSSFNLCDSTAFLLVLAYGFRGRL